MSSRTYYKSRILTLKVDEVLLKGRKMKRAVVVHPGSVAIVPFIDKSHILLIKQYRHPINRTLLEIPAGTLEEGEAPLACARRELREETGYRARSMHEIGSLYLAPGYSSELIHVFLASDLEYAGQKTEPDEGIDVEVRDVHEALREIRARRFRCDAKTVCGLFYASMYLGKSITTFRSPLSKPD